MKFTTAKPKDRKESGGMKKFLTIMLCTVLAVTSVISGAMADDSIGNEEEGILLSGMLNSEDVPCSDEFTVEKASVVIITAAASADFEMSLSNSEGVIKTAAVACFVDETTNTANYSAFISLYLEAGNYSLDFSNFEGDEYDQISYFGFDLADQVTGILSCGTINKDSLPTELDFTAQKNLTTGVYASSDKSFTAELRDNSGNKVYGYTAIRQGDVYLLSESFNDVAVDNNYKFVITSAEDDIVFFAGTYEKADPDVLLFKTVFGKNVPYKGYIYPEAGVNYSADVVSDFNFTAHIEDKDGNSVADLVPEYYEDIGYSATVNITFDTADAYFVVIDSFDGGADDELGIYIAKDNNGDCVNKAYTGADMPVSESFEAMSDIPYVLVLSSDYSYTASITDQDGNEIMSFEPVLSEGSYSVDEEIFFDLDGEYYLNIKDFAGGDKDSLTAFLGIDGDYGILIDTVISGGDVPISLDLTAQEDTNYAFIVESEFNFTGKVTDSDGNVLFEISPEYDESYYFEQAALLNADETYYLIIDSFEGSDKDEISIYVSASYAMVPEVDEDRILYQDMVSSADLPMDIEITPDETADYGIYVYSPITLTAEIFDSKGNSLIYGESEDDMYSKLFMWSTLNAGETYTFSVDKYPYESPEGFVITVFKLDDFVNDFDEITYYENGEKFTDMGLILSSYHGKDNNVSLPADEEYMEIGAWAFENKPIESFEAPEGLRNISINAFSGCSKLSSVTLPETVTKIGSCAFLGCDSLKEITLSSDIYMIEPYALGYDAQFNKIDGFVIKGYAGTVAETYALENGFEFVDLSGSSDEPITDPDEPTTKDPAEENTTAAVTTANDTTTGTTSVSKSQSTSSTDNNVNTGSKSYVIVIFVIVLVALGGIVVYNVIKTKKQK